MATYKTRTANLDETSRGRSSLRMTETEWENLDRIADHAGMRWLEWARDAVFSNRHLPKVEAVRKAIREALTDEKTGAIEPTDDAYDHAFVNQSRFFGDDDLDAIKGDLREVWAVDCGTFIARFGFSKRADGDSDPLMVIENRLKDGVHMAFAASYREEK